MPVTIAAERPDTPDATALINELQTHLESFYPPESRHGFSVDKLIAQGVAPDPAALRGPFRRRVAQCLADAALTQPADAPLALSGRDGRHTEPFGRLLAEMQFMQRAYPGAQW